MRLPLRDGQTRMLVVFRYGWSNSYQVWNTFEKGGCTKITTFLSSLSEVYILPARRICLLLLTQYASCALALARDNAGSSSAARIAMIAMTTSSSINVKAAGLWGFILVFMRIVTSHCLQSG